VSRSARAHVAAIANNPRRVHTPEQQRLPAFEGGPVEDHEVELLARQRDVRSIQHVAASDPNSA
jgi:hypothetical protein